MNVVVLMSTYQGEAFVVEQMRSILHQLPPGGRVLVRDDGSTDRTVERIEGMGDPRISIIRGPNLGFARSFFALLAAAPADADVLMLSDQDDVWLSHKIERACTQLAGQAQGPALYCSRVVMVDGTLRPLGHSLPFPRGPSFANALTENIVTGCTIAINRAALALVLRHGDPKRIYFHDWWMYLVVSAFGEIIADNEATMLYRQHGANVVGRGAGIRRYLVNLGFMIRKNWVHIMFNQIDNFREVHGAALTSDKMALLQGTFDARSPRAMARLLLTPMRYRQTLTDDFLLRFLVVAELLAGRGLLPRGT
ncbi:MAG TPA: glycosyltransferase family 2 protein [Ramlibacter sp.]|nr:glycosyltransferase family 2 protein [Ramlibacter sp.]